MNDPANLANVAEINGAIIVVGGLILAILRMHRRYSTGFSGCPGVLSNLDLLIPGRPAWRINPGCH